MARRPTCCRNRTAISALGAGHFRKKLLYEEMVDIPLDRLLEIGKADLHRTRPNSTRIAKELDPDENAPGSSAELAADHPHRDHLLQTFRDTFDCPGRVHPAEAHHHHSFGGPPDRRRNAALHARPHFRLDGYARAVRNRRHGSVFQRHAARPARHTRGDRRATWRSSIAARLSALRPMKRIRATTSSFCGCRRRPAKFASCSGGLQRGRLGALLRADDARRRLRPARCRRQDDREANSCASASCRMRCCAMPASSWESKCIPDI